MLSVEIFPAGYGDALLVSYGPPGSPTRLLVDGGLAGAAKHITKRLDELGARIDLFVITHIDADHIAGALRLLDTTAFTDRLGAVWFNGRPHLEQFSDLLGPLAGERVGKRLDELDVAWNVGWPMRRGRAARQRGGPVVVGGEPVRMPLPGGAEAIVLSPTPSKLIDLLPVWRRVISKAGLIEGIEARRDPPADPPGRVLLGGPTLAELAARTTPKDDAEANGSSIAFVLEIPGTGARPPRRILLTGDAHADALVAGLDALRGRADRFAVDVCKLPHHASRGNVTNALTERLACTNWIVSTNGKRFLHPDEEAIARVVQTNPGSTIYVNYAENEPLATFAARYPPARHDYCLEQPPLGTPGITVTVDP